MLTRCLPAKAAQRKPLSHLSMTHSRSTILAAVKSFIPSSLSPQHVSNSLVQAEHSAQEGQCKLRRTMHSVSRSTSTHSVRMLNASGAPGYLRYQQCQSMRNTFLGRVQMGTLLKLITASEVTAGSLAIPKGQSAAPGLPMTGA